MEAGHWAPLSLTGSFRPSRPALCWRLWSTAADIDHLSARNCTLLTIFPPATRPGLPAARVPLSSDCLADSVPRNQRSCFQGSRQIAAAQQDFFHSVYFSPRWKNILGNHTREQEEPAVGFEINSASLWEGKAIPPCSRLFRSLFVFCLFCFYPSLYIIIICLQWPSKNAAEISAETSAPPSPVWKRMNRPDECSTTNTVRCEVWHHKGLMVSFWKWSNPRKVCLMYTLLRLENIEWFSFLIFFFPIWDLQYRKFIEILLMIISARST